MSNDGAPVGTKEHAYHTHGDGARWHCTTETICKVILEQHGIKSELAYDFEATTSTMKAFLCYNSMVPQGTAAVLIEYSIHAGSRVACLEYSLHADDGIELLLRRMPVDEPRVIVDFYSAVAPAVNDEHSISLKGQGMSYHDELARYYDILLVSARVAFWRCLRQDQDVQGWYHSENNHHPPCSGQTTADCTIASLLVRIMAAPATPGDMTVDPQAVHMLNLADKSPDLTDSIVPRYSIVLDLSLVLDQAEWNCTREK